MRIPKRKGFSEKQLEVIDLLLIGKSQREMSKELGKTNASIKFLLSDVYYKTSTTGAIQFLAKALSQRTRIGDFHSTEKLLNQDYTRTVYGESNIPS